jgi:DNA-binding beta-propeller fold protein YncE
MIAGHQPFGLAMASSQGRDLLFVTNLGSGDLSIFDIDTRGLASSVHIGGKPGEVLITPDGGYALVVDRDSGDVSVVRMAVALNHERSAAVGQGTKPLFAVFPTGSAPQSAAIIPRPA